MWPRTIFMFLCFSAFSLTLLGQDKESIDFVMSARSEFRGHYYEYVITNADLKDTPKWDSRNQEPPLSVLEALKIARNNLFIFVDDERGWEATSIRLTSTSKKRWYYFVSFSCTDTVCVEGSGSGFNILVKMDGNVIRPSVKDIEPRLVKPM